MRTLQQITVSIPTDHVVIPKDAYRQLLNAELQGTFWSMKDLENRVGRKQKWIREKILLNLRFRKILDVENGGFVFYPTDGTGEQWAFQATKMAKFLDTHFAEIMTTDNEGDKKVGNK